MDNDEFSSILNSRNVKDKNRVRYHFKNLYFINGTFYFYTIEENIEIDNILVIYNDYLNIQVIKLNNKEELNNILDNTEIITITEPTGYAYHYYDWNVAHGLCDTLYPLFLNYLHFFSNPDENFNMFLKLFVIKGWKFPSNASRNWLLEVFNVFCGGKLLLDHGNGSCKNYKFENIFIGNASGGLQGATMNINASILGKNNFTLEKFRDRMYNKYNINYNEYNNEDVLIIDSDRLSRDDKCIMSNLKDYFLKKNNNCSIVQWRDIPNFKEQLKVMSKVKFHISGSGTSLYNFMFLRDGSINLLLGTSQIWSISKYPGLMDMPICLLSNSIYSYYYDIVKYKIFNLEKILNLVEEILNYDNRIHILPDAIKIWNELCIRDKDNMNNLKLRLSGYIEPSLFQDRAIELIIYEYKKFPINYSLLNEIRYYYTNEKNIFQIYHDKKLIPEIITNNIKKLNPHYNYRLLDFEEGKDIIRKEIYDEKLKNKLLDAIDMMPRYCHKSDVLRYALLYIFGGCYLDVDLHMLVSFEKYYNIDFMVAKGENDTGNGLMVARKNSPILLDLILQTINNNKLYDKNPDYRDENIMYLFNYLINKCQKNNIKCENCKLLEIDNEKVYLLKGENNKIENYGVNCFLDKDEVIMTPNNPLYKIENFS
jgi:mannosyltransferase OCH1-like enzyme